MPRITCSEAQSKLVQLTQQKDNFLRALENVYTASTPVEAQKTLEYVQHLKGHLEWQIDQFLNEFEASPEKAREILGDDFYGKEEIKVTYGFDLSDADIPPIPYSAEELEWAKEQGMMLMLFLDKDEEGNPLTGKQINSIVTSLLPQTNHTSKNRKSPAETKTFVSDTDKHHYEHKNFYLTETASRGWRLISKNLLPGSTDKTYIEQTKVLRTYLEEQGMLTEEDRIESNDTVLNELNQLSNSCSWDKVGDRFINSEINQVFRPSCVEEMQKFALMVRARNRNYIPECTWTRSYSGSTPNFFPVCIGYFSDGLAIRHYRPNHTHYDLGVVFSHFLPSQLI